MSRRGRSYALLYSEHRASCPEVWAELVSVARETLAATERHGVRARISARMLWEVVRWRRQCRGEPGGMNNNLAPYYGADLAAVPGLSGAVTRWSPDRDRAWAAESSAVWSPSAEDLL